MSPKINHSTANNNTIFNGIFSSLVLIASLITATSVYAESEKVSVSFSEMKKNISAPMRDQLKTNNIEQAAKQVLSSRAIRFSSKTRTDIISMQQASDANQSKSAKQLTAGFILPDFSIYTATSYWKNDYDYDGYNQTFSVTFDADLYSYDNNQIAEVYAVLYLSRNGGDWVEYHTTNTFVIESDLDADEYEVITTLVSGYPPSDYDVLIDLYTVGYSDIVATYSSDDNNALYALPLESADFDEPYVEVIEVIDAGSMSTWLVLLLLVVSYRRLLKIEN
jgi:hypothetical protein